MSAVDFARQNGLYYVHIRRGRTPRAIIRIGRNRHPLWTERHQGSRGIPRTWWYAFGRRLSVRLVLRSDR